MMDEEGIGQDLEDIPDEEVCRFVHYAVHKWMEDTASTADTPQQIGDMVSGMVAALAEFCWTHRAEGRGPEDIAKGIHDGLLDMLRQMEAQDAAAEGRMN